MKIAMIGAGVFGTALGGVLEENGHLVDYFDIKFKNQKLSDVVNGVDYIVLCVPSCAAKKVISNLPKNTPLIIATKGLMDESIFKGFKDYMVISGPGFADDVKAKKKTLLTATDKRIVDLFTTEYLTFDFTNDVRGVLMCGALKNVYAIGAGLKGLARNSNDYKMYIDGVCFEMKEILSLNGADPDTVDLACGVLDLALSCGYPSRNYEFGDLFRQDPNRFPHKTTEGLSTIKLLLNNTINIPSNLKILNSILERFKNES